ncbi:MAG: hypothetical protein AAGN35_01675 [Bacteroidota bacterium]
MGKQSRTQLKNIFSKGNIPDEQDFHDLIDSMANLVDDRIEGDPGGGVTIYEGSENNLLGFYASPEADGPTWYIHRQSPVQTPGLDIGESDQDIAGRKTVPRSRLFIRTGSGIGVDEVAPKFSLDVNGTVGMKARVGTFERGTLDATGQWFNILPRENHDGPEGYFAYEVMAYTKSPRESIYHAALHAVCVGAFPRGATGLRAFFKLPNRRGITLSSYYYSKRRHRLELRWEGLPVQPRLEIRTRRPMRGVQFEYRLTNLLPPPPKD